MSFVKCVEKVNDNTSIIFDSIRNFEEERNVINKYKFKYSIFLTDNDNYVINIYNYNDNAYIKSKIARGYAIYFDKSGNILGKMKFYEKFGNISSKRLIETFDERDYTFMLKYSGFLGNVMLLPGYQYIITSKKSSMNDYIDYTYELIDKYMTRELFDWAYTNGILSFSFEVMSKNDVNHGYDYKESFFVTTCIYFNTDKYANNLELKYHAQNMKLPWDETFKPDITSLNLIISGFYKNGGLSLDDVVDIVGDDWKYYINHHKINKPWIEGFILIDKNGKRYKFKNPIYTMITMLIRPIIQDDIKESNTIIDMMDNWVNRWIISDERKEWWVKFANHALRQKGNHYERVEIAYNDIDHISDVEMIEPEYAKNKYIVMCKGVKGSGKSTILNILNQYLSINKIKTYNIEPGSNNYEQQLTILVNRVKKTDDVDIILFHDYTKIPTSLLKYQCILFDFECDLEIAKTRCISRGGHHECKNYDDIIDYFDNSVNDEKKSSNIKVLYDYKINNNGSLFDSVRYVCDILTKYVKLEKSDMLKSLCDIYKIYKNELKKSVSDGVLSDNVYLTDESIEVLGNIVPHKKMSVYKFEIRKYNIEQTINNCENLNKKIDVFLENILVLSDNKVRCNFDIQSGISTNVDKYYINLETISPRTKLEIENVKLNGMIKRFFQ